MTRRADARQPAWKDLLGLAVLLFCLGSGGSVVRAGAPCTKSPDLWFPPPGTPLSHSAIAVQEATASVCQGGTIQVTTTVDNLTCGDAGAFDVGLYYDADDAGHLIASRHVDHHVGCEHEEGVALAGGPYVYVAVLTGEDGTLPPFKGTVFVDR
jgi:hypothetical protein